MTQQIARKETRVSYCSMTVYGKISNEELQQLKKKVAQMERLLEEGN